MEPKEYISIREFCSHYNLSNSFLLGLQEQHIIEFKIVEEDYYIHHTQIRKIEKIVRLHYDLEINMEGIFVINNLLDKLKGLNEDIVALQNKLKFYEDH